MRRRRWLGVIVLLRGAPGCVLHDVVLLCYFGLWSLAAFPFCGVLHDWLAMRFPVTFAWRVFPGLGYCHYYANYVSVPGLGNFYVAGACRPCGQ